MRIPARPRLPDGDCVFISHCGSVAWAHSCSLRFLFNAACIGGPQGDYGCRLPLCVRMAVHVGRLTLANGHATTMRPDWFQGKPSFATLPT